MTEDVNHDKNQINNGQAESKEQKNDQNATAKPLNKKKKAAGHLFCGSLTGIFYFIFACCLLLVTGFGQRAVIRFVDGMMDDIHIESVEGSLQRGLVLHQLNFANENLTLSIAKTDLQFDFTCLLDGKICIDNLTLAQPKVEIIKPFPAKKSEKSGPFSLPVAVQVKKLNIHQFAFKQQDLALKFGQFSTALLANQQQGIQLLPTQLNDVTLHLTSAKKTPSKVSQEKKAEVNWAMLSQQLNQAIFKPSFFGQLPIAFQIKNLSANHWHLWLNQQEIEIKNLQLKATGTKQNIKLQTLTLASNLGDLQAQGELKTVANYPLDLSIQANIPKLDKAKFVADSPLLQQLLWQPNQLHFRLFGDLKDNTKLSIQSLGTLPFQLTGEANFNLARTPFQLHLSSEKLQYPFSHKAKTVYHLQNIQLGINGNLLNYALNINAEMKDKKLPMSAVSLYARGGLTQLDVKQSHFDIGEGKANFDGRLNWYRGLKWKTNLQLEAFQFGNYLLKDLPGVLSGNLFSSGIIRDGQWDINVPNINLKGMLSHKPFLLNTSLKSSNEKPLDLKKLLLNYGNNHIEGQGHLSQHSQLALTINAPQLDGLLPSLKAYLKGKIQIEGEVATPTIKIDLEGKHLAFQQYSLQSFNLHSDIQSQGMINGLTKIDLKQLQVGSLKIKNLDLDLQGNEQAHTLLIHSKGEPVALNLDLNGHWNRETQQWQGKLKQINIPSLVGKWVAQAPIDIQYSHLAQQAEVAPHCWENKKGQLCFNQPIHIGKQGDLAFQLKHIDLAMMNQFIHSQVISGVVNGKGKVQWFADKPLQGMVNLSTQQLFFKQKMDYRTLHLKVPKFRLLTKLHNNQLNLQNFIYIENQGHIDTNINVKNINDLKKLTGSLQIHDISLNIVQQLLSKGERVTGNISGDLKFSGNLNTPQINGGLFVKDIYAKVKTMPFDITEGNVNLEFFGDHSTLEGKIATKESHLNLYGLTNWQDLNHWDSEISLNAKDFYLDLPILPTIAKVKITPDIYLKAQPHLLQLSGKVNIPWARIDIIKLPSSGVSVSPDLVILNGPNKSKPNKLLSLAKTGKTSKGTVIESDLKISLGDDVNLKAYGLDTYLTGLLSINQQKGVFGLYGQVDLDRGSYKSFGQDLLIQNGNIIFSGIPSNPALNIKAIRNPSAMENKEITAGILVSGNVDNPQINVFSNPAMSQDQAFSYLLTGHSLENNGDASSSSSIGTALLAMSLAQSGKAVGNIGKVFGIHNLNLGTAGMGESSKLEVSGNLTQNLQVKYGIGLFDGLAELTLRYRLLPRLYLQTVSSVNQAVDLLYQFEM